MHLHPETQARKTYVAWEGSWVNGEALSATWSSDGFDMAMVEVSGHETEKYAAQIFLQLQLHSPLLFYEWRYLLAIVVSPIIACAVYFFPRACAILVLSKATCLRGAAVGVGDFFTRLYTTTK